MKNTAENHRSRQFNALDLREKKKHDEIKRR